MAGTSEVPGGQMKMVMEELGKVQLRRRATAAQRRWTLVRKSMELPIILLRGRQRSDTIPDEWHKFAFNFLIQECRKSSNSGDKIRNPHNHKDEVCSDCLGR